MHLLAASELVGIALSSPYGVLFSCRSASPPVHQRLFLRLSSETISRDNTAATSPLRRSVLSWRPDLGDTALANENATAKAANQNTTFASKHYFCFMADLTLREALPRDAHRPSDLSFLTQRGRPQYGQDVEPQFLP